MIMFGWIQLTSENPLDERLTFDTEEMNSCSSKVLRASETIREHGEEALSSDSSRNFPNVAGN